MAVVKFLTVSGMSALVDDILDDNVGGTVLRKSMDFLLLCFRWDGIPSFYPSIICSKKGFLGFLGYGFKMPEVCNKITEFTLGFIRAARLKEAAYFGGDSVKKVQQSAACSYSYFYLVFVLTSEKLALFINRFAPFMRPQYEPFFNAILSELYCIRLVRFAFAQGC